MFLNPTTSVWKLFSAVALCSSLCQSNFIHSKSDGHHHKLSHPQTHRHEHHAEINSWLSAMTDSSLRRILDNISPEGTEPGCVVASPSKHDPDYFYYWVRDGALTMDTLAVLYEQAAAGSDLEKELEKKFKEYIHFVKKIVNVPNRSGHIGEPKYHVSATAFDNDWGRPQNDGPPLQAILFMNLYRISKLKGSSDSNLWKSLFDKKAPSESLIKVHLDHTLEHWNEGSFDLWEENYGDHFWTKMVQRKALVMGAQFAQEMGDQASAELYSNQIPLIENALLNHWDQHESKILENLHQGSKNVLHRKPSGLDVGTVLAALRGGFQDRFFTPDDDRVLSTTFKLMKDMKHQYTINHEHHGAHLGAAIGRYPEDVYDGHGFTLGNPWYLATNAVSELLFVAGQRWAQSKEIHVTLVNHPFLLWLSQHHEGEFPSAGTIITSSDKLFSTLLRGIEREADAILLQVKKHVPEDGRLSEQFNRATGTPQGARDLTWSYSSILEVAHQRESFLKLYHSAVANPEE